MSLIGERVEWVTWLQDSFGNFNFYWTRESLWKNLLKEISNSDEWYAYEFGVAWGYTSNYWLKRTKKGLIAWHGFDRFTGLPRSWRDLEASAFDAHGNPPPIQDARVSWHVGNVEDELPKLKLSTSRKVIFFDLDLYEPTAFAWQQLSPFLQSGDLVYFDEGFDSDERKVINELVLKDCKVAVIGATHSAVAFRIIGSLKAE